MSFGIIGYGAFGKLLVEVLKGFGRVSVYSRSKQPGDSADGITFTELKEAASKDIVILAVDLDSLEEVTRQIAGLVESKTVVVDVCSVKLKPIEILNKNLKDKCHILATHPLFGPQTIENHSIAGKSIVVCPTEEFAGRDKIIGFLKIGLKLKVIEMSAEEHDKEMAWVHALTFFVGRGVTKLNPPKSELTTAYYQKLLDLVELESSHSIELFNTVQRGNPFAEEIRQELIDQLKEIDAQIRRRS